MFSKDFKMNVSYTTKIGNEIKVLAVSKTLKPTLKSLKVQKIINPILFEKFHDSLYETARKNNQLNHLDMIRFLFHGTNEQRPDHIYTSEYGFDFRQTHNTS